MGSFLALAASYLIGSISFSYLIAKKLAGIDIRKHGSGNAGATNTLRLLGKGPAALVLVLDALKGLVSMGLAWWLSGGDPVVYAFAGILAIVGHNWPIYYGFRGGKGIATTLGVAIGLSPQAFLVAAVIAVVAILITRYVSLGSLLFVTCFSIFLVLFGNEPAFMWISLLIVIFAFLRHTSNIVNLLQGKERKLGDKSVRKLH